MNDIKKINMLVSFMDIKNFARNFQNKDTQHAMDVIDKFYETVGDSIEPNGGEIIKFIGDSALIVFSEDKVDIGIRSLLKCKKQVDKLLKENGRNSQLLVQAHFGEVVYGNIRTKMKTFTDVLGETVNAAALLKSNGFAMTPQAFRKLKPDTRKLFKKHTPPITYIAADEYHKD